MKVYYWIIIIEDSHSVALGTHFMFYDRHVSILVFHSCALLRVRYVLDLRIPLNSSCQNICLYCVNITKFQTLDYVQCQ